MRPVSDIMTRGVVTVGMDDTLEEIREIFEAASFHHLLVVDGHKLAGVISDRDLLKHVSPFLGRKFMERGQDSNTLRKRAHQIMTRRPISVLPSDDVNDAAQRMLDERVSCLPVVDETGRVAGILTWRDLLRNCIVCTGPGAAPSADAA